MPHKSSDSKALRGHLRAVTSPNDACNGGREAHVKLQRSKKTRISEVELQASFKGTPLSP